MAISVSARQRLTTGLWGGRKAGSFDGRAEVTPPAPSPDTSNAGPGGRLFGKHRNKVIRFSDFESREAYAQALQAAIPMSQVRSIETIERTVVDDDDDDVVFMIMRMLH